MIKQGRAKKATRPLSARLSISLALQTIFGLGIVCVAVYLVISQTLYLKQTDALDHKQVALERLLNESKLHINTESLQSSLLDFLSGHDDLSLVVRKYGVNGEVLFELLRHRENTIEREFSVKVSSQDSSPQEIAVTLILDRGPDNMILRHLAWTLGIAAIASTLIVSISSIWLVKKGLSPINLLITQTRQVSAQNLIKRLDDSQQPQELMPLIRQINDLLDRLSVAYRQMESFNADVAHELNTPLSTLISSAELALRKRRTSDELVDVLSSNLEDLHRMASIIADMLFLSNADRGNGAQRMAVSSLAELAREVIEFHEASLLDAGLEVAIQGEAKGILDASLLRRALSNLLGNATRYASKGSKIIVDIRMVASDRNPVTMNAQHIQLTVTNEGQTIDPSHLPRLFDRFYRADSSRTQARSNHGLGLAIVAAIARLHQGNVFARSEAGVTSIGLIFPQISDDA